MEETAIRAALERVASSEAFRRSPRCTALLRHIVEEYLCGRAHLLQGTTIAQDVFGRDESFDSNTDPIVRVQAGRLRNLLEAYYRGPGVSDPLVISIPKGGYTPKFGTPTAARAAGRTDPGVDAPASGIGGRANVFWRNAIIGVMLVAIVLSGGFILMRTPEPALQVPNGPKIHVLEFRLVGHDAYSAAVTKGFQTDLTDRLSRFKNLFVYGPDASDAASPEHTADIGDNIFSQPDFILTGSIGLSNSQISVTTQLLDVASATIIWSDKFEKAVSDPNQFAELEDAIIGEVAAALGQPYGVIQGHLSREAEGGAAKVSFRDYVCLGRFYDYARKKTAQDHALVRECLETATSESPNFSSGWAALSWIYGDEQRYGFNPRSDTAAPFERSLDAARMAVDSDPYNDMAHEYLAVALFMRGNNDGFRRAAETALSLNPNNTESLASFGGILIILDGSARGKALAEKAIKLNPGHPPWFHTGLALYYYQHGDFEAANLHATAFHQDNSALSKILLAAISARAGFPDSARDYWIDLAENYPEIARDPRAYIEMRRYPEPLVKKLETDLQLARVLSEDVGL